MPASTRGSRLAVLPGPESLSSGLKSLRIIGRHLAELGTDGRTHRIGPLEQDISEEIAPGNLSRQGHGALRP
jgi:hypothetical protein